MGFLTDLFGGGEARRAARAQEEGYNQARGVISEAGHQAQQQFAPYQQTSQDANRLVQAAMGGDMSGFEASPDYQFRLQEGEQALERAAAAQGRSLSGAQMKALGGHNQNLASTEYGNWFNRMAGLRGEGIGMSNQLANIGMNTAQGVADTHIGGAGARASGYMAKGNIKSGLANAGLSAGFAMAGGGMPGLSSMFGGGGGGQTPGFNLASVGQNTFGNPFA